MKSNCDIVLNVNHCVVMERFSILPTAGLSFSKKGKISCLRMRGVYQSKQVKRISVKYRAVVRNEKKYQYYLLSKKKWEKTSMKFSKKKLISQCTILSGLTTNKIKALKALKAWASKELAID